MKRLALYLATLAVLGTGVSAQPPPAGQPAPPKEGTIIKGKAPVSKEVLRVKLPKPEEADLANGVHLIVLEDHRAPQVRFQLIIEGAGGYYDPPGMSGLASFAAALMREGTTTKTSEQISEDLDRLAATVTAGAGISAPSATVTGSGLTNNLDTVLGIMADVLMHPAFAQSEIDRYKARTKPALASQRAQPGFLAAERLNTVVYGDHPSGRVSPALPTLDALTRDPLVEFHRTHYVPDRAVLAVAGDITMAQAKQKAEAVFGSWKRSGAAIAAQSQPAPLTAPTVSLVDRPKSVQTSLRVGTQALERANPEYEALMVANTVLGADPSARLFEHLREQKGYTYGAYSNFSASRIRGGWTATTEVRTDVTDPALTDLMDDIRQMRDVVVPDKELARAKKSIVASFALSLESPNAILSNYVERYVYKLPADYWDTYPARIEAVTAADVQRVAQKYWAPERLQIVAVADRAKVEPALKKLGTVQVFDADGKPVK